MIVMANKSPIEIAEDINNDLVKNLENRISAVLLYGSSLYKKESPPDIDLLVIFKTREDIEDLKKLNEIWLAHKSYIDLQVTNLQDIKSSSFSHDSHGEFFVRCLKNVPKVLYGTNPFLDLSMPYTKQVSSLLQKMQYYFFQAKKRLVHYKHIPLSKSEMYLLRKRLLHIIIDFNIAFTGQILDRTNLKEIADILKKLDISLATKFDAFLFKNESLDIVSILELYIKVYFTCVDILETKQNKKSLNLNGLHIETSSSIEKNKQCCILVSGIPSNFNENEISLFLNIHKFDTLSFSYRGTGLSHDKKDISVVYDFLEVYKFAKKHYDEVMVIGNSFGAYCVLQNTKILKNERVILISPVFDFKYVSNISTLPSFIKSNKNVEYRWDEKSFNTFLLRKIVYQKEDFEGNNITVIHGSQDDQIPIKYIRSMCEKYNIILNEIVSPHLSLNKLSANHIHELYKLL